MVLRARRPAARGDLPPDRAGDPRRGRDLEAAGVAIIQIDEPALREGLPLRARSGRLPRWAVDASGLLRRACATRRRSTPTCATPSSTTSSTRSRAMDADVISIETSRSEMELLEAFADFALPERDRAGRLRHPLPARARRRRDGGRCCADAAARSRAEQLWVNPDCGLKTRGWAEVGPALENMVAAARRLAQPGREPPCALLYWK